MRLATPLATAVLAAALLAGCGSSSGGDSTSVGSGPTSTPPAGEATAPAGASARSCETDATDAEALQATAISCGAARELMYGWQSDKSCALATGASRGGCSVNGFRCVSTAAGRGIAVSCSRPGQSVAFIVKRG